MGFGFGSASGVGGPQSGGGGTGEEADYPAVADVRDGTNYDDGDLVGNLVVPAVSDVRDGVAYGSSGTEATGRLQLPATTKVVSGTWYGDWGQEFVGTVTLPVEEDVESGVQYGVGGTEFTGSLEVGESLVSWISRGALNAIGGDTHLFSSGGREFIRYYDASLAEWVPWIVFQANQTWTLRGAVAGGETASEDLVGYEEGTPTDNGDVAYAQGSPSRLILRSVSPQDGGMSLVGTWPAGLSAGFGLYFNGLFEVVAFAGTPADRAHAASFVFKDGVHKLLFQFVRHVNGTHRNPYFGTLDAPSVQEGVVALEGTEVDLGAAEALVEVWFAKAADRAKSAYCWVNGQLVAASDATESAWSTSTVTPHLATLAVGTTADANMAIRDHRIWSY